MCIVRYGNLKKFVIALNKSGWAGEKSGNKKQPTRQFHTHEIRYVTFCS